MVEVNKGHKEEEKNRRMREVKSPRGGRGSRL